MIHRERLLLPASLLPMLATPGKPPDHRREDWGVEMKWDGVHGPGGLLCCGHVGTGFSTATLRMPGKKLEALRRPGSPFDGPVPAEFARAAVWVEPRMVIEVAFDRWTSAGRMRAPVYTGLRDDKDPAEVVRET